MKVLIVDRYIKTMLNHSNYISLNNTYLAVKTGAS